MRSDPGKSWKFVKPFSRPGKSWNFVEGPGKSWKNGKKNDKKFAAERNIEKLLEKNKISERAKLQFRNEIKSGLCKLITKLQDKSPLKYPIVTAAQFVAPQEIMLQNSTKLPALLKCLEESKRISTAECDEAKQQHQLFVREIVAPRKDEFVSYDNTNENTRIDSFYQNMIGMNKLFNVLYKIIRLTLILSHGQATVERGFSVNKELSFPNLTEKSFVAQRVIYDHIQSVGGSVNVQVSYKLVASCGSAHAKYKMFLQDKKDAETKNAKAAKRATIQEEISTLKNKKARLESDVLVTPVTCS